MDPLSKIPEIAKDFVENYYKLVDHARHKLKDIYCIGCKITWDGRPVPFTDPVNCPEFQKLYLEEIPISKHDVRSVDAQPMTLQDTYIIINVSGFVSFGSSNPRPFTENFVIMFLPSGQGMEGRIITDCFRLLA